MKYKLKIPSIQGWVIVAIMFALIYFLNSIDVQSLPLPAWERQLVSVGIMALVLFLTAVEQHEANPSSLPPAIKYHCIHEKCNKLVESDHHLKNPGHRTFPIQEWRRPEPHQVVMHDYLRKIRNPPPASLDFVPQYLAAGGAQKNQVQCGCCVGVAWSEAVAFTSMNLGIFTPDNPIPAGGMASDYIYWWGRNESHSWNCNDTGLYPIDGPTVLIDHGVCLDKDMPFNPYGCVEPDDQQNTLAAQWKSKAPAYPIDPSQFKIANEVVVELHDRTLVVTCIPVFSSFFDAVSNGGKVPTPQLGETLEGGHALPIIGHDDTRKNLDGTMGAIKCVQSWGQVGDLSQGISIFWLGYSYFTCPSVLNAGGSENFQLIVSFSPQPPVNVVIGPTSGSGQFAVQSTPPVNPAGLLTVTFDKATYNPGDTVRGTWLLTDAQGNVGASRLVQWTCLQNSGSFTTDANGKGVAQVTAGPAGTYTMNANYAGDP